MGSNLYFRLLTYVKPYWWRLAWAMAFMVVLSGATATQASLSGPFIAFIIYGGKTVPNLIGPLKLLRTLPRESLFYWFPLVLLGVSFVKGASYFGQAYLMGYVGQRVLNDLRNGLYRHIQHLPLSYFTGRSTGDVMSRITNDVYLIQGSVTTAITSILKDSLSIVSLLALIVYLDWKMAAIALCVFPGAVVIIVKVGKRIRRVTTKSQETYGLLYGLMHEAITGIRIVKAFGMEAYEARKFFEETQRLLRNVLKVIKTYAAFVPGMEFISVLGVIAAFWYGLYRFNRGDLSPENFISFFTALFLLYPSVKALSGANNTIQEGLAAASRVFTVLDSPVEAIDGIGGTGIVLGPFAKRIEFKGISFAYDKEPVLRDISFSVRKGDRVALVGMSGAGKTSLVNLLLRFYDRFQGKILIDGVNIKDIPLSSLRSQIGMVTQQVILFNDTVRNNIAYGDITRTEDEIIRAARAANAHGFVSALPAGYGSLIGEGGVKLSGGERQRLAIARAILKDAPILVMDEATSSLDSESEEEVQKALDVLMRDRTSFVIAHRLSTVRNADAIIVLSKGRLVEMGKHEDLLRKRGEYFRLYEKQFKGAGLSRKKRAPA